jgi:hypothetical protein
MIESMMINMNNTMKFDLHVHSFNSYDSKASIKSILWHAKNQRLSGIAITDHQSFKPVIVDTKIHEKDLWIISGSEIHTDIGDIIGLFITQPLKSRNSLDLLEEIKDQNGISILAHPFKRMDNYPLKVLDKIDAIEIINSRWKNLMFYENLTRVSSLLSLIKGRSAGSDAHFAFEVGRAHLLTPQIQSHEELKQIIINGSGQAVCQKYSAWLDEMSQGVQFLKDPSFYQLFRILFRIMRRMLVIRTGNTLNE